jgi:tryptophan halogenase
MASTAQYPSGEPVRTILIIGGGAAGWMTAGVLARCLPAQLYSISLVEPAQRLGGLATLDAGEATLPPIAAVHQLLGLDDAALLGGADATYSLGSAVSGFAPPAGPYFRTFGRFGANIEGVAFHNLLERMRRKGMTANLEEYSIAAVAARLGRFAPSAAGKDPLAAAYDHGWHLDAADHRALLREAAQRAGVARVAGEVADVVLRGADGFVEAVLLADGRRLEADLFIDCTPEATLIEGALGSGWEDWRHWLPCDRAIAARVDRAGDPPPYWQAEAQAAGWRWRIPLGGSDGHGLVYASGFCSDDEAEAALRASLGSGAGTLRRARFASGRRRSMWIRNCVAIGEAACVLDPLEPTALQIAQDGIGTLLDLMPRKACNASEADEFNRLMAETVERMRDFLILRYKANARAEPFWAERRAMAVPDLLAHKMRVFEATGRVLEWDEETFFEADWVAVYFGQGMRPRTYDALADTLDAKLVREQMTGMRNRILAAAEALPTHRAFIEAQLGG